MRTFINDKYLFFLLLIPMMGSILGFRILKWKYTGKKEFSTKIFYTYLFISAFLIVIYFTLLLFAHNGLNLIKDIYFIWVLIVPSGLLLDLFLIQYYKKNILLST